MDFEHNFYLPPRNPSEGSLYKAVFKPLGKNRYGAHSMTIWVENADAVKARAALFGNRKILASYVDQHNQSTICFEYKSKGVIAVFDDYVAKEATKVVIRAKTFKALTQFCVAIGGSIDLHLQIQTTGEVQ